MDRARQHLAKDLRGRDYVLQFQGATLTVVPDQGGVPARVSRESFANGATVLDGLLSKRTVVLPMLGHLSLRLPVEAFQALRVWLEPCRARVLARSLRRITVWQLVIGTLFVAASGPWLNEDGTWDLPMAALGALAIATGLLSVSWPRRAVYALEMLWSVALAAVVTSWIASGDSHPLWLGISVLLMLEAYGYGRLFMFWGPVPSGPPDDDGSGGDERGGTKPGGSMFGPPEE